MAQRDQDSPARNGTISSTASDTAVQMPTSPVPFISVSIRLRVRGVRSVHATSRIWRW